MPLEKVVLSDKLALFQDHWSPRIVGELNSQHVKLVKFQGEFVWHQHEREDELFLVIEGEFNLEYQEDGNTQALPVRAGEFVIVPRGTVHRPVADREVHVMLFEPAGTLNTGDARDGRTVEQPARI